MRNPLHLLGWISSLFFSPNVAECISGPKWLFNGCPMEHLVPNLLRDLVAAMTGKATEKQRSTRVEQLAGKGLPQDLPRKAPSPALENALCYSAATSA